MKSFKKFFALVAVMAMVMSMFSGIAVAAQVAPTTAALDKTTINADDAGNYTFTVTAAAADEVYAMSVDPDGVKQTPVSVGAVAAGETTIDYVVKGTDFAGKAVGSWKTYFTVSDTAITTTAAFDTTAAGVKTVNWTLIESPKATVDLSATKVVYSSDTDKEYNITGTILLDGKAPTDILTYTLKNADGDTLDSGITGKGQINLSFKLEASDANTTLTLSFSGNDPLEYTIPAQDIDVAYNVVLDQDFSTGLTYGDEDVLVSGKLTDAEGKTVKLSNIPVTFEGAAETTKTYNGTFAVKVNLTAAGDEAFKVLVDGQEYYAFDVATIGYGTLEVAPTSTVYNLLTSFDFTAQDDDDNNIADTTYTISGVKIDKSIEAQGNFVDSDDNVKDANGNYTTVVLKGDASVKFLTSGTAKVAASNGNYEGELSISVTKPADLNVNLDQDELNIGTQTINARVTDIDGNPITKDVKITAEGPGFDEPSVDPVYNAGTKKWDIQVEPNQAGTVKLTFEYDDNTVTKEVKVTGYTVTVDKSEVTVNDTNDITVTVVDADGKPVNHALVTLAGQDAVDGRYANITNGVYVFEDAEWTTVGDKALTVTVFDDADDKVGTVKANFTSGVEVLGEQVYTVTVDKTQVKAGESNTLDITVTNADGNKVNATVEVTVDDGTAKLAARQSDGTYEIKNVAAVDTIHILASTEAKTKIGEADVTVVKPVVTASVSALTDGYNLPVTFTIADGVTGEALEGKLVEVDKDNVGLVYTNEDEDPFDFDVAADTQTVYVLPTITDTDKDAYVEFNVVVGGLEIPVELKLPVKAASFTVTPNALYLDGNNATVISLKDADGKGIAEKEVKYMGTVIGETNANGEIAYNIRPAASGKVTFVVNREDKDDKDAYLTYEAEANVVQDDQKPVITLDTTNPTTKSATVTISGKVTDNVKISRVYVNNADVLVIPGAESTFQATVNLNVGANNIRVVAFDATGNASEAYVTVTRVLPTVVKLAIGSADATISGQPATTVAPYLKGNSTMVPFRFIGEALGATVNYDAATNSVTYNLEGTTIVLTIGSTTAMVNGSAVTMAVAPEIVNDRTMVPVRFVSENLGATVDWTAAGGITITR